MTILIKCNRTLYYFNSDNTGYSLHTQSPCRREMSVRPNAINKRMSTAKPTPNNTTDRASSPVNLTECIRNVPDNARRKIIFLLEKYKRCEISMINRET